MQYQRPALVLLSTLIALGACSLPPIQLPTVNPPNGVPSANAGADITACVGDSVTLDASGSSDQDGDSLTYSWTRTNGPSATLSNPRSLQATLEPRSEGTYEFTVTVSDGRGSSATDSVRVQVDACGSPAADGAAQGTDGGGRGSGSSDPGPVGTGLGLLTSVVTVAPDPAMETASVSYQLFVGNNGTRTLFEVEGSVVLPPPFRCFNAPPGSTCRGYSSQCCDGETLRWFVGELAPGTTRSFSFAPPLDRFELSDFSAVQLSFHVTASDGTQSSATRSLIVREVEPPLGLAVTPVNSLASPGEQITFSIAFTVGGGTTVLGATLRAEVPEHTTFLSATEVGDLLGNTVQWSMDQLNAGSSANRQFTVALLDSVAAGSFVLCEVDFAASPVGSPTPVSARAQSVVSVR